MDAHQVLTAEPMLIDLGPRRRATITATVPFIVGGERHCANYPHVVTGHKRHREVLIASLVDRPGTLKVWPNGQPLVAAD